jgi:hypothetical protein
VLAKIPDALMLDARLKTGARMVDRVHSIGVIARPLLGVDPKGGAKVFIRIQPHNRLFVTRDPDDTILFPIGHPRAGQARYKWSTHTPQIEIGYLNES